MPRRHLVLVPGFVGFDALGQVDYYAGVTSALERWRNGDGPASRREAVLHYFDSFPTASVAMRAERLRSFLAKRLARGAIAPGDEVTLVGHSTGGLDIRKLLDELLVEQRATRVDDDITFSAEQLAAPIKRVVFLSVPHFGSGLADFCARFRPTAQAFLRDVTALVSLNRAAISRGRQWIGSRVGPRSDLLLAIGDSLNESDESGATEPQRAQEREARAQLLLWLDHMSHDFGAIDDLRSFRLDLQSPSPAHASRQARDGEVERMREHGIRTQSYATRVRSERTQIPKFVNAGLNVAKASELPLRVLHGTLNTLDSATSQWLLPSVVSDSMTSARIGFDALALGSALLTTLARPSAPFEYGYAACARGLFADPAALGQRLAEYVVGLDDGERIARDAITPSDSDGIVNTLSMLWPPSAGRGELGPDHETFLVEADHADIIGHYTRHPEHAQQAERRDRVYTAYDILASAAGFSQARFDRVWHRVFAFAF